MRLGASAMPISYIHASVSALGTGARGVISDAGNRDFASRRNVDQRECKKTRERERGSAYSPVVRSAKNARNNIIIYRTIPSRALDPRIRKSAGGA